MTANRPLPSGAPDPNSAEYREKLLRKLEGLIVILEVALARIQEEMKTPRADAERLGRVSENLNRTLRVCRRARAGLERGESVPGLAQGEAILSPEKPAIPDPLSDPSAPRSMTFRDYVELSSLDEFQRFRRLPPVRLDEVKSVDLDSLLERLGRD
jgi:hypothetical protein